MGGWGAEFNFAVGSDFSQLEVVMGKSQPGKAPHLSQHVGWSPEEALQGLPRRPPATQALLQVSSQSRGGHP